MAVERKTNRKTLSSQQQELLVTELEKRPELLSARIAEYRKYTKLQLKESWEVVAEIVSGERGIRVCGGELKARWLKWKSRVKSKAAFLKKNVNEEKEECQVEGTVTLSLTPLEDKVLKLLVKWNSSNLVNNEELQEEIASQAIACASNVIIGAVYHVVEEDIQTASPQLSLGSASIAESSVCDNARESPIFFQSAVMAPLHKGSTSQAVKRKHRELTLTEKLELLKKINSGVSVKELCEVDNTGVSTVYAMTAEPKTMRRNLSSRQQELLVTELEKRPELLSTRISDREYTKQQLKERWEIIAQIVSSEPGMKVSGDELKARWCKWKCRIKSKAAALNEKREVGQVEGTITLTPLEEKVLKFLAEMNSPNLVNNERHKEITSETNASASNVVIGAVYQVMEEDIQTASPQLSLGSVSIAESSVSSITTDSPIFFESAECEDLLEQVAEEQSGPHLQNERQESPVQRMFNEIIHQQLEVSTALASLRDAMRDQTEVFRETNSILREIVSAIRK